MPLVICRACLSSCSSFCDSPPTHVVMTPVVVDDVGARGSPEVLGGINSYALVLICTQDFINESQARSGWK